LAGLTFVDVSSELGGGMRRAHARLAAARLHLLVDLNGYTTGEKAPLLARRPAPVQTHAVGYPGTMGASFVGYMALDRAAMPPRPAEALSERLLLMPHCYQANDHASYPPADGSPPPPASAAAARRLRFVNFNQVYKISDETARAWCGALLSAPRSALWLLRQPSAARTRDALLPGCRALPLKGPTLAVRRPARRRGAAPPRRAGCVRRAPPDAIAGATATPRRAAPNRPRYRHRATAARAQFAPLEADIRAHLRRVSTAQLLLDTLEYNCHTTGSDALWAGVPALTLRGEQMASRVGASLLGAAGVPPSLAHSVRGYQQLATELASTRREGAADASRLGS
jgi:predicted O-linked N-acetylglucosamine transferase (SPINDLY family)